MVAVVMMLAVTALLPAEIRAPERASLSSIPGELVQISLDVSNYREDGGRVVRSEADYHVIVDIGVDALFAAFRDHEGLAASQERMLEYDWELVSEADGRYEIREYVVTGFEVMGFSATYDSVARSIMTDRLSETIPAFTVEYGLIESRDGKLKTSEGWFYAEEVTVDGRPMTYLRQYNLIEITATFFGLEGILRRFAMSDAERTVNELVSFARVGQRGTRSAR